MNNGYNNDYHDDDEDNHNHNCTSDEHFLEPL
jgi:hypothetical protein